MIEVEQVGLLISLLKCLSRAGLTTLWKIQGKVDAIAVKLCSKLQVKCHIERKMLTNCSGDALWNKVESAFRWTIFSVYISAGRA